MSTQSGGKNTVPRFLTIMKSFSQTLFSLGITYSLARPLEFSWDAIKVLHAAVFKMADQERPLPGASSQAEPAPGSGASLAVLQEDANYGWIRDFSERKALEEAKKYIAALDTTDGAVAVRYLIDLALCLKVEGKFVQETFLEVMRGVGIRVSAGTELPTFQPTSESRGGTWTDLADHLNLGNYQTYVFSIVGLFGLLMKHDTDKFRVFLAEKAPRILHAVGAHELAGVVFEQDLIIYVTGEVTPGTEYANKIYQLAISLTCTQKFKKLIRAVLVLRMDGFGALCPILTLQITEKLKLNSVEDLFEEMPKNVMCQLTVGRVRRYLKLLPPPERPELRVAYTMARMANHELFADMGAAGNDHYVAFLAYLGIAAGTDSLAALKGFQIPNYAKEIYKLEAQRLVQKFKDPNQTVGGRAQVFPERMEDFVVQRGGFPRGRMATTLFLRGDSILYHPCTPQSIREPPRCPSPPATKERSIMEVINNLRLG